MSQDSQRPEQSPQEPSWLQLRFLIQEPVIILLWRNIRNFCGKVNELSSCTPRMSKCEFFAAAMVEIDKEKEHQKIERLTTGMFPSRDKAPTAESRMKEMAEGIVELGDDHEKEAEQAEDNIEKVVVGNKPKTRRQLRDKRKKMFEDQRKEREKNVKTREIEISRIKSIKKQLKSDESKTLEKQEKKKAAAEEKLLGPVRLSNYKYEPQEIEIKLSDELTGNLRNLKQEGSLLEDRFKSLQRRNMIEVRVKQKVVKKLKRKTFEKRSHKMGWEENQNKVNKRIRMESRMKRRKQ